VYCSEWQYPKIPGIENYKGKLMHSARWDQDYDYKNKTVAVIGGGSSSVQIVPELQKGMCARSPPHPISC
jgi:cation diffusion facilitator CzcD-associated flavoprotein CzcO